MRRYDGLADRVSRLLSESLSALAGDNGEKFRVTEEWMSRNYDELNREFFGGRLGGCAFEAAPIKSKILGQMGFVREGLRKLNDTGRMFLPTDGERRFITPDNFVEVALPFIRLNTNYQWTVKLALTTLLHEMCHYYTYMDGFCPKQSHGSEFKSIAKAVASASQGLFPIQRLVDSEWMEGMELDPEVEAKEKVARDKRRERKVNSTTALLIYHKNGVVELLLTASQAVIKEVVEFAEYAGGVKVYASNDPKTIDFFFANGYTKVRRSFVTWFVQNRDWLPYIKDNGEFELIYRDPELDEGRQPQGKNMICEYLDKDYMLPLWRHLQADEKEKYLDWLSADAFNLSYFLGWLFNDLNDLIEDGECNLRKFRNKFLRDAYDRQGLDVERVVAYIDKNYERFKPYLQEYFKIRLFTSPHYDPEGWHSNLVFQEPRIVHGKWLIHFSKRDGDIGRDKSMMKYLGYTYMVGKEERTEDEIAKGGYSFAYDADEMAGSVLRECMSVLEYGGKITMFRGNGIEVYHPTDREYQVIYNPKMIDRNSIVHLTGVRNEDYYYRDEFDNMQTNDECKAVFTVTTWNGKPMYRTSNLPQAVRWVMTNFDQYRGKLNRQHDPESTTKLIDDDEFNFEFFKKWQKDKQDRERHMASSPQRDFLYMKRLYDELPEDVKCGSEPNEGDMLEKMQTCADRLRRRLRTKPEYQDAYDKVRYFDPIAKSRKDNK